MGFYFELSPKIGAPHVFEQGKTPLVFWVLYGILGFALACMAGAAYPLLADLAEAGGSFDRGLFLSFQATLPLYVLLGLVLAGFRKELSVERDRLCISFRLFGALLFRRTFLKAKIDSVALANARPSQNVAVNEHDDEQYYFRGHWRVQLLLKKKKVAIDKHNEREALLPLYETIQVWLSKNSSV